LLGACFLVGPQLVITCHHVVHDSNQNPVTPLEIRFDGSPERPISATLLWTAGASADVAVLRLSEEMPLKPFQISVGIEPHALLGRAFLTYGYPFDHGGTGVDVAGKIAGSATHGSYAQRLQLTVPPYRIQPGFSGAPVFIVADDGNGYAIGVVTDTGSTRYPDLAGGSPLSALSTLPSPAEQDNWFLASHNHLSQFPLPDAILPSSPIQFQTQGTLPLDSRSYVPRPCDLELKSLIPTERLIVLNGDFEIGKSSLLVRAQRYQPTGWHALYKDLTSMRTDTVERFVDGFFQLMRTVSPSIHDWNDLALHLSSHPSLFLFDEFGALSPPVAQEVVPKLIWLTEQARKNFSIVVSLPNSIAAVFGDKGINNPKYSRNWRRIRVAPFGVTEVEALLAKLPPPIAKIALPQTPQVLQISGGHPRRVQCLCASLCDLPLPSVTANCMIDPQNYDYQT
jgi:hypothetical protein